MAEEKMCPAAAMRSAYDTEIERWEIRTLYETQEVHQIRRCKGDPFDSDPEGGWEVVCTFPTFEEADEQFDVLSKEAGHRAALRALAAMEPTLEMKGELLLGSHGEHSIVEEFRAALLAAAEEGEKK